jgi:plasmid stabilization system protein ParE
MKVEFHPLIVTNLLIFAEVNGIRRALLRRFPYSVLYRILDDGTVRILAIRHHKRHPDFGFERQ